MPDLMNIPLNDYNNNVKTGNKAPITAWMLRDEPNYYEYKMLAPYFHNAAQYDTTRMVYVNLLGDPRAKNSYCVYEEVDTISGLTNWSVNPRYHVSFRQYIEDFCEKFKSGVLTYDYYPFFVEVDTTDIKNPHYIDKTITDKYNRLNDFYTALQLYSEISKKRNRPFWAFCQSRGNCVTKDFEPTSGHPAPTEDYLRYEAFNALAFGAQGIQYWNYFEEFSRPENYNGSYYGLVTKEGEKTPAWYFAQKINKEIKSYTDIFLGAKLDSYYFVGDPHDTDYPDYKQGSSTNAIAVKDLDASHTTGSNQGALVSTLVNGNSRYVVIVNQSPYNKVDLELAIDDRKYWVITISKSTPVTPFPIVSGDEVMGNSIRRIERVSLPPAQYMILSYRSKSSTTM